MLQPVVEFVQQELGGKISKASVSARLTDSPCILVTSQQGWNANMQRIMKSQPMGDNRAMDYMKGEKIMEINPDNQVCPLARHGPLPRLLQSGCSIRIMLLIRRPEHGRMPEIDGASSCR